VTIGWLYKLYLRTMARCGTFMAAAPHHSVEAGTSATAAPTDQYDAQAALGMTEVDRLATRAGNHYRGLGIAIGLMGIAIVFLAIAPVGLELDEHTGHTLGYLKVFLMALMLVVVFWGRRSRASREWIRLRALAESLRYQPLGIAIERVRNSGTPSECAELRTQLLEILQGPHGQIAYNVNKAHQYHAIERISDALLWVSVFLALAGAIGHLWAGWAWWIFLTAFLPAAIGGVHGINGFLGIGGLLEEHESTAVRLQKALTLIEQIIPGTSDEKQRLTEQGQAVREVLATRDARWKQAAAKLGLRPA
jgi:hypothetical protein